MVCMWCLEFEEQLHGLGKLKSTKFTVGCTHYRLDSLTSHETSEAQISAGEMKKAMDQPKNTPASIAYQQLNEKEKLKLKFCSKRATLLSSTESHLMITPGCVHLTSQKALT